MKRPEWLRAPSFNGQRLAYAGTELKPIEIARYGPVGLCKATVVAEAIVLESGLLRFRVTEHWDPLRPGFGEITETTVVATGAEARELAGRAADEWRTGTSRSERLAPNGRLRAETPTANRSMTVPEPIRLVDPK